MSARMLSRACIFASMVFPTRSARAMSASRPSCCRRSSSSRELKSSISSRTSRTMHSIFSRPLFTSLVVLLYMSSKVAVICPSVVRRRSSSRSRCAPHDTTVLSAQRTRPSSSSILESSSPSPPGPTFACWRCSSHFWTSSSTRGASLCSTSSSCDCRADAWRSRAASKSARISSIRPPKLPSIRSPRAAQASSSCETCGGLSPAALSSSRHAARAPGSSGDGASDDATATRRSSCSRLRSEISSPARWPLSCAAAARSAALASSAWVSSAVLLRLRCSRRCSSRARRCSSRSRRCSSKSRRCSSRVACCSSMAASSAPTRRRTSAASPSCHADSARSCRGGSAWSSSARRSSSRTRDRSSP
mmetsp:Transcript_3109/g.9110  ORF Transcript_3109/g.9110 Transcript_3109/m.9110 type:complete len:362 (-) Transcript_3109:156-1241(-)